MNLIFKRKSSKKASEILKALQESAEKADWQVLGSFKSEGLNYISFCSKRILEFVVQNPQAVAFLPCQIVIKDEKEGSVLTIADPHLLATGTQNQALHHKVHELESELKNILIKAADLKEPEVEKIILYSTQTCPYCKMEAQWLADNKIEHEVVYVDKDQKAAERMVRLTGQMGVPVTEVVYKDSEPEFVIGFDKNKLSQILAV